jgi:hypothetical protein
MRLSSRRKDGKRQVTAGKEMFFESTLNSSIAISTDHRIPFPQSQCSRRKPRKPKHLIQSSSDRTSKYIQASIQEVMMKKLLLQKQESTEKPYAGFHLCVTPKNSVIGQEDKKTVWGIQTKETLKSFFDKMLVDVEDGRW